MTTQPTETLDLDMLAVDLAKMLDRHGYNIDASADDIRAALPAFVDVIRANAATISDEPGDDAATWVPEPGPVPEVARATAPKLGRVRIKPVYVFAVDNPTDPERDRIEIADLDKRGEAWARQEAQRFIEPGESLGRLVEVGKMRHRPWANR